MNEFVFTIIMCTLYYIPVSNIYIYAKRHKNGINYECNNGLLMFTFRRLIRLVKGVAVSPISEVDISAILLDRQPSRRIPRDSHAVPAARPCPRKQRSG